MRNRAVVLASAFALALALGALATGAPGEVVNSGVPFVRTDDHGHRIMFVVDHSTVLPDGLAVGRHVRIVYRANGSTGQTAEKVTLLETKAARPGSSL
jgi:hypothetical protein